MEILNRSAPGIVLVDGLSPYTFYLVQVEACTQFGCTMSPLVAVQTLEAGKCNPGEIYLRLSLLSLASYDRV